MTCARAVPTNAIAPTIIAAHTPIRFESLAGEQEILHPKFSDLRPFCPADRADGDQPLDVCRTIAEIGKNRRPFRPDPRGRPRAGLRLPVEGEPGWCETFRDPTVTLTLFELHGGGRVFAMPVGEFLTGLDRRRRDVLLRAPGKRLSAVARAKLGGDVARRLPKDPAVAELIDPRTRRHAGGKLAARARRRFATRALKQ